MITLKLLWNNQMVSLCVYAECLIESEVDLLQADCNNMCIALKWACYSIYWNDNAIITHHSIQKQKTISKKLSMDSFNCQCKCTSLFSNLFIKNKISKKGCYWCLCPYIAAGNTRELQVGCFLANGTRSTYFPIHFYTNVHVLISFPEVLWF